LHLMGFIYRDLKPESTSAHRTFDLYAKGFRHSAAPVRPHHVVRFRFVETV
jgi:hypothetical protein